MSRPTKPRRVCTLPTIRRFVPTEGAGQGKSLVMTVDELEALRLIDIEGISQEDCAARMNVARTTAQSIYNSAREKTAKSLVYGYELIISGGNYMVCDGNANCRGCEQE